MIKHHNWINTALIGVVLILVLVGNQSGPKTELNLGAAGTRFPSGLSADSISPSAGEVRGTTLTITGAASFATTTAERITEGGLLISTTTDRGANLLVEETLRQKGLDASEVGQAVTYTFAASSTMTNFLPNSGDSVEWYIIAPATNTVTFVTGVGFILKNASSTSIIQAGGWGKLSIMRAATSSDIFVGVIPFDD